MRLTTIKLAGFKSFVDPTTLHIHSNLTGVVGPNGCGKSNIIDAVRWVLGESSMKQLRAAESEDVIFNGSKDRKPVGRASIDLIFDNSEGRFGDRYKTFSEIAVKRELSRDGTSTYWLNGARCRRRDIVDLFLGTGVAGRENYAIIQQGTVSRFVEAKPDELRLILEEAAGISRYKERRRETENRIKHTRENLDQYTNIRREVVQQLERLQKQAANAEKYKQFKQEERRLKAELLALRWRALGDDAAQQEATADAAQQQLAERQQRLRAVEQAREQQQSEQQSASHALQGRQAEFYAAEAEMTRVESSLQHAQQLKEARQRDLDGLERQTQELTQRVAVESARQAALQVEIEGLAGEIAQSEALDAEAREQLAAADRRLQEAQDRWEAFTHDSQEPLRLAEGEKARVEQLQRQLDANAERLAKLEQELQSTVEAPLVEALREAEAGLAKIDSEVHQYQLELTDLDSQASGARARRAEKEAALHEARQALQGARGRLASLEALQQAALREDDASLREWLSQQGLESPRRLAQSLDVDSGWERAVEAALGNFLQALCVDGLDQVLGRLKDWPKVPVTLLDPDTSSSADIAGHCVAHSLASKLRGPAAVLALLAPVYAVETEAEAQGLRTRLQPGHTLVTRSGLVYGPGWVQHPRGEMDEVGVIGREHALRALRQEIQALETKATELDRDLGHLHESLSDVETRRSSRAGSLDNLRRQLHESQTARQSSSLKLEQIQGRRRALEGEVQELRDQLEHQRTELGVATARLQELQNTAEQLNARRQQLQDEVRAQRQRFAEAQAAREAAAEKRRDRQVQWTGRKAGLDALLATLAELGTRIEGLAGQRGGMMELLAESNLPLEQHAQLRQQAEERQRSAQQALQQAREQLTAVEARAGALLQQAHEAEQAVEEVRDAAQQARLNHQTIAVRRQGLEEQVTTTGHSAEALSAELPEAAAIAEWEEKLAAMDRRIQRLGDINMAAISEHDEMQRREAEMSAQIADLTGALEQLERAIHQIDRETKTRFKETFDRVDGIFRQTFPKLFGGGEAYLELMGEDLLETGVRVMARPPGKRNSVIQQLSGGEKALTAVALLFALFELNPAPFCLLDEVDAPLDDNNVGRFCELVKEMSERVQFVVITHNKITMEMAHHLHGVTMQEPGVSRLVSVDVDQAVAMTATG